MEKRFLQATEMRASKAGKKMVVRGYAARYGVLSHPIPVKGGCSFRELIERGAFDAVLASKPDVVATFNHDMNKVLGRTAAGTLRLKADAQGLAFECDLPNTTAGRDVWESVQRGDLKECSFAFGLDENMDSFDEEDVTEEDEGLRGKVARNVKQIVRRIRSFAKLFDISIVSAPAYPSTSVEAARSLVVSAEVRIRVNDAFKRAAFFPTPEVKPEVTQAAELDETVIARRRDVLNIL
jgi:HK97 family phage prohead protease